MPQSVTQYRRNTGDHVNWSDKQQGNQKNRIKTFSNWPHSPGAMQETETDSEWHVQRYSYFLYSVQYRTLTPVPL